MGICIEIFNFGPMRQKIKVQPWPLTKFSLTKLINCVEQGVQSV